MPECNVACGASVDHVRLNKWSSPGSFGDRAFSCARGRRVEKGPERCLGGQWTIRVRGHCRVAVLVSVASLGSRICRIDRFRQVDMNDWIVGRNCNALTVAHWELVSA